MAVMNIKDLVDSKLEELRYELGHIPESDSEAMREQAGTKAKETVDADPAWSSMSALAERTIAEGKRHWGELERQKESLREKPFHVWKAEADERWAGILLDANRAAEGMLAKAEQKFPLIAIPAPVTTVDALNLENRLRLLGDATPEEAKRLVKDGVTRKDAPFCAAARTLLKSWPGHRNSWSSPEARKMAMELLEMLDSETPDMTELTGEYASERIEGYRINWRYLLNGLLAGDGRLDPVHRQVGALAPLLSTDEG